MMKRIKKGSALVVALLFTTIFLYIGITLVSIISKEFIRLNILEQSQTAFTIADMVLECVVLYDSRFRFFEATHFFGVGGGKLICPFYEYDFENETKTEKTLISYPVGEILDHIAERQGDDIIPQKVTEENSPMYEYFLAEDLMFSNPCARMVLTKKLKGDFVRTNIEVFGYSSCSYDTALREIITGDVLRTIRAQK